jgi:hypothetical protein
MTIERPKVDLTGCHYDALEKALTNHLNIKVILVKAWEASDSYHTAYAERIFAQYQSQQALDKAQAGFLKEEASMLGSLRSNIAARDPFVGVELSPNDLRSLQKAGHITLRQGNAEPPEAVVIFDPGERRRDEPDPVLWQVLSKTFEDVWYRGDGIGDLPVAKFIENFDIAAEDLRVYQALMNVRYALQNQHEFDNKDKGWYYEPYFYNFARLSDSSPGMWKSAFEMPFQQVVDKLEREPYLGFDRLGVEDEEFADKLRLAGAIMNLQYNIIETSPYDTFARLELGDRVTPMQIIEIQQDLRKKLQKKVKEHRAGQKDCYSLDENGLNDWRILFPVFREIYEEDKSEGPQRAYLDTIMEGLQKWFPTLTNGPVPVLDPAKEPPRELQRNAAAPKPAVRKTGLQNKR